jgi:RNA recognition motif-containing protein
MAALLIVDHLPQHFSDEELTALFLPFGTVRSARLVRASQGYSLDFGFVEFENDEDAHQAVAKLDGLEIHGHRLTVTFTSGASSG